MPITLHKTYPQQIENPHGVIIAVKLLPCGLPKEGPKPASFTVPFAIVYASNLWDNEGMDVAHWDFWQPPVPDNRQWIDDFVRSADLTPNVWYYLDILGEEA